MAKLTPAAKGLISLVILSLLALPLGTLESKILYLLQMKTTTQTDEGASQQRFWNNL